MLPISSATPITKNLSSYAVVKKGTYTGQYGYNTNGEQYAIANISGSLEMRILGGYIDGVWILDNNGYHKEDSMRGVFIGHLFVFTLSGVRTIGLITFDNNGHFNGKFKNPGSLFPILDIWGIYQLV